jgi:hypothetical protein
MFVMPALAAGIHVFFFDSLQDVDGRDKPGHDGLSRRVSFPGRSAANRSSGSGAL